MILFLFLSLSFSLFVDWSYDVHLKYGKFVDERVVGIGDEKVYIISSKGYLQREIPAKIEGSVLDIKQLAYGQYFLLVDNGEEEVVYLLTKRGAKKIYSTKAKILDWFLQGKNLYLLTSSSLIQVYPTLKTLATNEKWKRIFVTSLGEIYLFSDEGMDVYGGRKSYLPSPAKNTEIKRVGKEVCYVDSSSHFVCFLPGEDKITKNIELCGEKWKEENGVLYGFSQTKICKVDEEKREYLWEIEMKDAIVDIFSFSPYVVVVTKNYVIVLDEKGIMVGRIRIPSIYDAKKMGNEIVVASREGVKKIRITKGCIIVSPYKDVIWNNDFYGSVRGFGNPSTLSLVVEKGGERKVFSGRELVVLPASFFAPRAKIYCEADGIKNDERTLYFYNETLSFRVTYEFDPVNETLVKFHVRDNYGIPVQNFKVTVDGKEREIKESNGVFSISLERGEHYLVFSKPGFVETKIKIEVGNPNTFYTFIALIVILAALIIIYVKFIW